MSAVEAMWWIQLIVMYVAGVFVGRLMERERWEQRRREGR